nr:hypothetical protein [Catenulispora pinisilvae]
MDVAEAELDAISGLRAGRVRLAAFPSALGTFVPSAFAAFAAAHPGHVAVQALVAAGLGVTTLPGLALAAQRNPAVRAVALAGHERLVSAAVHGDPPDTPATTALLSELARFAALPLVA